jgi:hypothetical protein
METGKRSAVRITNSGEPVDHSGPGLRVGPTIPATSDRKSEACPPGLGSVVSQHKSGQGFGDGVPVVASGASGDLRSEATQRFSSLDEIQNNRNTGIPSSYQALGRNPNCGIWTVVGVGDGSLHKFHRLNCKCWSCKHCGPKKAKRYRYLIAELAEKEQLTRFVTLTLDPKKITGNSVRHLRCVFNKFRLYLGRRYGGPIKYIAVLEFQQNGIAHLHVLVDRFIPQAWIAETWSALGGGNIVDIRYVDVHRVARYVSKYLTKELLLSAPKRSRRVTTSRSLHLLPKKDSDGSWELFKVSIFHFFSRLSELARDIKVDEDGALESFACVLETV